MCDVSSEIHTAHSLKLNFISEDTDVLHSDNTWDVLEMKPFRRARSKRYKSHLCLKTVTAQIVKYSSLIRSANEQFTLFFHRASLKLNILSS